MYIFSCSISIKFISNLILKGEAMFLKMAADYDFDLDGEWSRGEKQEKRVPYQFWDIIKLFCILSIVITKWLAFNKSELIANLSG